MRTRVRETFYAVVRLFGILGIWRWSNRNKVTVLTVHGVISKKDGKGKQPTRWQLEPTELDKYLSVLTRQYTFIPVSEAVEILKGRAAPRKHCAVFTIDDGYVNALTHAWPILKKYKIPAVVFVVTGQMTEGKPFWWDRLDYALLFADREIRQINLGPHKLDVNFRDREALTASSRQIVQSSRLLFRDEYERRKAMEALIDEYYIEEASTNNETWVGVMTPKQVANAFKEGMEIGSHTVNHYRLPQLDVHAIRKELRQSKATLEALVGVSCDSFCFPEGSVDATSSQLAKEAGYKCGFGGTVGLNKIGDDLFDLKRIDLPQVAGPSYLLAHIAGLSQTISDIRKSVMQFLKIKILKQLRTLKGCPELEESRGGER